MSLYNCVDPGRTLCSYSVGTWTDFLDDESMGPILEAGAYGHGDWEWTGNTESQIREIVKTAKSDKGAKSKHVVDGLVASAMADVPQASLESHLVGSSPRIGAFLAGDPLSMRRMEFLDRTKGCFRLFVNTTSDSMVNKATLKKRGEAISALVLSLQAVMPVELFGVSGVSTDSKEHVNVLHVGVSPLDQGRVAALFQELGVTRFLMYRHAEYHMLSEDWFGGDPWLGFAYDIPAGLQRVGLFNPGDIFVPAILTNAFDAEQWLRENINTALKGSLEYEHGN